MLIEPGCEPAGGVRYVFSDPSVVSNSTTLDVSSVVLLSNHRPRSGPAGSYTIPCGCSAPTGNALIIEDEDAAASAKTQPLQIARACKRIVTRRSARRMLPPPQGPSVRFIQPHNIIALRL